MARTLLTGHLTLTVAQSGTPDFSTIQDAINSVYCDYDFGGKYWAKITIADGTYEENVEAQFIPTGFGKGSWLRLVGNVTTPGNVIIKPAADNALTSAFWAPLQFEGLHLEGGTTGAVRSGLAVWDGGIAQMTGKCSFGPSQFQIYGFRQANIQIDSDYEITGGGNWHMRLLGNSEHTMAQGKVITITNPDLNFANEFIQLDRASASNFRGTFAGNNATVTGKRWESIGNSFIKTWGANPDTLFPGNENGTKTFGGECG